MILALLQARMSSSRLPGKVLKPILGKPMLFRQMERLQRARTLDQLVIATSDALSDAPIERFCAENRFSYYRGSLNDVLDRFYRAAKDRHPEYVVRVTGDCPLIDPDVTDQVVRYGVSGGFDYATNALKPTYPDGLDIEVFRFSCLEAAWREASLPSQREHVTPFLYQHPERFKIGHYAGAQDLSHLRWTVDEALDFELISQIYETLYPLNPAFTTSDVLALLERSAELKMLNKKYERNEGYKKSLQQDAEFIKATKKENH